MKTPISIQKNIKNIKKITTFFLLLLLASTTLMTLSGCSDDEQKAPCPHFGRFCTKTPINSWSSNDHA